MKGESIALIIMGISLFILGFAVALFYIQYDGQEFLLKGEDFREDCSGLDILDTAECLRQELSGFYNFNKSNVGKELTFTKLKEEGGVCKHAADWYSSKTRELGFNVDRVRIQAGEEFDHAIAIISNEKAYCVLDQTDKWCFKFGRINLNETK